MPTMNTPKVNNYNSKNIRSMSRPARHLGSRRNKMWFFPIGGHSVGIRSGLTVDLPNSNRNERINSFI